MSPLVEGQDNTLAGDFEYAYGGRTYKRVLIVLGLEEDQARWRKAEEEFEDTRRGVAKGLNAFLNPDDPLDSLVAPVTFVEEDGPGGKR